MTARAKRTRRFGWGDFARRWARRIRALLSVILVIIGTFLLLTAAAEFAIYLFDSDNHDFYQDYTTGPLTILLLVLVIAVLWLVLNYDRIPFVRNALVRVGSKGKGGKRGKIKDIELPEFD